MTALTRQTIWREGTRIRRTDGIGYGDQVSDDGIRLHMHGDDPLHDAFAEAVLAIRAFERLTGGADDD